MSETHSVDERGRLIDQVQRDGFAVLRSLISSDVIDLLREQADDLWRLHHDPDRPHSKVEVAGWTVAKITEVRRAACEKRLLDIVLSLLGPNIYVNYIGFMMNPPQSEDKKHMAYHQDGGRISKEHSQVTEPRYSLKAAIWLTDGMQLGAGNFYVIPGSHRWRCKPHEEIDHIATPILVRAGDAILFERRVWHTRKVNTSSNTRKVLFIDFSPRWMEPKCQMASKAPEVFHDPIEDQLFRNEESWRAFAPRKSELPTLTYMIRSGLFRRTENES